MKKLTAPHVASLAVIAVGLALGALSWLAPLPNYALGAMQIAGLALPLVGSFALGFLWLIHSASSPAGARQAVVRTWTLQPVLGFSLGTLGGFLVTGQAYPGSLFGLAAGSALAWVYRRAAA